MTVVPLRCANIASPYSTAARITSRYYPNVSQRRLKAKIVNFTLHIRSDSLSDRIIRPLTNEHPASPELRSINHTISAPLHLNPLAVSIETKTSDAGHQKARAQLALWASAHLTRLAEFVVFADRGGQPDMPTLPLVCVVGSRWFLYFICRQRDSDTRFGEHVLGDTASLISIFKLIASLRRITKWVDSSFLP